VSRTCIYYDVDELSAEEQAAVRARVANGAEIVELAAAGTAWPSTPRGEQIHLRAAVDPDFQAEVMAWFDVLLAEVARQGFRWERSNLSLLEVARYRLVDRVSAWDHRWRSLCEIAHRWPQAEVLWVSRRVQNRGPFAALLASSPCPIRHIALDPPARLAPARALVERVRMEAYGRLQLWRPALFRRASASPGSATVVFAEYFPNSVHAVLPIARILERELGISVGWLAGRDKVAELLHAEGVGPVFELDRSRSLLGLLRSEVGPGEAVRLRRALASLPDPVLRGTSDRVAASFFRKVLWSTFLTQGIEASHMVAAMEPILAEMAPRALVSTTYSSPFGRAAAAISRKLGITTFYVQHGLLPARPHYYRHFVHDHVLVWGDYERRAFAENSPRGVTVTGSTIYDSLCSRPRTERAFPTAEVRVALLASRSGGMFASRAVSRRTIRCVAEAARSIGVRLRVKAHPGDKTGIPEEVLRDYPEAELWSQGSSQELIADSDVVVITSSTTGNEACVLDRPLIVLNLTEARDLTEFVGYGAAVEVTREEDFEPSLHRICTDPGERARLAEGRRRLIDDMLHGGRGDAARLAARAIRAAEVNA
jgi:hypothetical protein